MIAAIFILQASKIRGEREFVMKTAMNTNINTNTTNSKKVIPGINDVATKCPKVAAMWSDKNTFSPSKVAAGSRRKFTFVCPDCGQEFESKIFSVVRSVMNGNTGCPVCAGKKIVSGINDVATKCPMAAAMWSDKNAFTPSEAPAGSHKKAIFVCPDCGQEFESSICNVVNSLMHYRTGCPVCRGLKVVSGINDLATKCPAAANMWGSKNACSPNEVSAGNNKMAWFVCPDCKQEFKAPVCNVVNSLLHDNTGCPVCAGRKAVSGVNDLATMYPKAAAMWSGKNDYAPSEIPARSSRRAIFVCPDCKQEFVTSIHNMTRAIASGVTCCPNCRLRGRAINAARKDEYGSPKSVGTTMTMKDVVYPCPYCRDTKILANHMDLETYLKKNNREDILNCIRPDSPYQASEVSYSSNKTLFLNCPECGNKWVISANYLTAQGISYMCGNCNQTTNFISKPEQYAVRIAMGFARENGVPNAFDEVRHIFGYNNKYGVDFVDNTRKVCMEYNGVYWHKDKKRVDCYKFIKIHNAGYTFIRILEPGLKAFDKKYDIVLPKNYKHGNEYESKIMEDLGYKLISLFEEIYNYKATPEIQKLVDFKEFEKWYDIHRKRISAKATDNAAKKAA